MGKKPAGDPADQKGAAHRVTPCWATELGQQQEERGAFALLGVRLGSVMCVGGGEGLRLHRLGYFFFSPVFIY